MSIVASLTRANATIRAKAANAEIIRAYGGIPRYWDDQAIHDALVVAHDEAANNPWIGSPERTDPHQLSDWITTTCHDRFIPSLSVDPTRLARQHIRLTRRMICTYAEHGLPLISVPLADRYQAIAAHEARDAARLNILGIEA